MDILVMENIFYNRDLFPVYDLKGSERARLARDDPSDPTRVLMDQNLIQSNLHDPILVSMKLHEDNCLVKLDCAVYILLAVLVPPLLVSQMFLIFIWVNIDTHCEYSCLHS